ncbi:hypothetical protein MHZ93_12225 [Roseomonas sp. ACRSG]|nr:hypothetical protein [Roseomonas sp. ACRSG]
MIMYFIRQAQPVQFRPGNIDPPEAALHFVPDRPFTQGIPGGHQRTTRGRSPDLGHGYLALPASKAMRSPHQRGGSGKVASRWRGHLPGKRAPRIRHKRITLA